MGKVRGPGPGDVVQQTCQSTAAGGCVVTGSLVFSSRIGCYAPSVPLPRSRIEWERSGLEQRHVRPAALAGSVTIKAAQTNSSFRMIEPPVWALADPVPFVRVSALPPYPDLASCSVT
jgi:hypothetical protein